VSYQQITLDQLASQLGVLLEDPSALFWTTPEKYLAIQEGLLEWGALSNYWRSRGQFQVEPNATTAWVDLSVALPTLRARTWTLGQLVQEIQFSLNEAANGISGAGMSGQVTIADILNAIKIARNRFVIDCHIPFSIHPVFVSPPPPDGMTTFDQSCVYCHRAAWQDTYSGIWTNLWREDAWAYDKGNTQWTLQPGNPTQFSEAELAPLQLQLVPAPQNTGTLEAVTVDSLQMDLTNPASTFNIPDEWVHAVKYAALAQLLSGGSQIIDPLRAQYCQQRYSGLTANAMAAGSVIRILVNNVPCPLDSVVNLDAGVRNWRNNPVDLTRQGTAVGTIYDMLAFPPVVYEVGVSVDVVASCPIPIKPGDFIPMGTEDIQILIDYCIHLLMFKCGGNEFKATFAQHDRFVSAAAARNRINQVKIHYLEPLLGQPQREWAMRPDREEVGA